ncbi:MAG TPA: antitoxin Xre/MbcA/ParS toxin-binding domain-containing protein [Trueperaceae bacterium]|nr:antitoxin Xre/MbcA/ParS toxin-binding domain-containing protein [Trueperaceae bacterium]
MEAPRAYRPTPNDRTSVLHELGVHTTATRDLIAAVKRGLGTAVFEGLSARLGISEAELAGVTGISASTLLRRKKAGRLSAEESEHVLRVATLLDAASRLFGSIGEGAAWLRSANTALGGASPLAYADTEVGAREVENLLGRIAYGVYS